MAQTAAAMLLEQKLEPVFHRDSYGYRPGRSAHDALGRVPSAVLDAGLGCWTLMSAPFSTLFRIPCC